MVLGFPLFYGLYHAMSVHLSSHKLATNFVSFVNCNGAIMLSLARIFRIAPFSLLRHWLISYFVYDSIVIVTNSKCRMKIMDSIFLLHHGLSILTLIQQDHDDVLARLMLIVEMSNWPMYICKYYILRGESKPLKIWKRIQFLVYAPLRIGGLGYFFLTEDAWTLKCIGAPIYLMGIAWSFRLWKSLS